MFVVLAYSWFQVVGEYLCTSADTRLSRKSHLEWTLFTARKESTDSFIRRAHISISVQYSLTSVKGKKENQISIGISNNNTLNFLVNRQLFLIHD